LVLTLNTSKSKVGKLCERTLIGMHAMNVPTSTHDIIPFLLKLCCNDFNITCVPRCFRTTCPTNEPLCFKQMSLSTILLVRSLSKKQDRTIYHQILDKIRLIANTDTERSYRRPEWRSAEKRFNIRLSIKNL